MKQKLIIVIAAILCFSLSLQEDKPAYMAKFIVSLVRYIEWPGEMQKGNFIIGVYGSFDMYKAIVDETVDIGLQGRNTDIMNLAKLDYANLTRLHMLILAEEKCTKENIKLINEKLNGIPTILVTNKEGTLEQGAGINFVVRNDKLAYELDKSNARKNGIKIGSQVINFAYRVVD